jgi:hypothetical protein
MPRADPAVLLRDVEEAGVASIELSDTIGGSLEAVWRYAGEIIGDDDVWEAVDRSRGTAARATRCPTDRATLLFERRN